MELNKEQSAKYIELVKTGNKDDMFDYGVEVLKSNLIQRLEGEKKFIGGLDIWDTSGREGFYEGIDKAIKIIKET